MKKISIIGSGFSSLAAASYLAKDGYEVSIYEKNTQVGGRARQLKVDGFTFDIGPTFYWMPDVFEDFFNDFGVKVSDYYELKRLNPSYRVYFGKGNFISIEDSLDKIKSVFESIENGSAAKLQEFISKAEDNYNIAIKDLVYKPGESIFEIINLDTAKKLGLFVKSIKSQVANYFTDQRLRSIMEFPVLFLGAKPSDTPAFYNFMNYADFSLGTWHPTGGMYKVVEAMKTLAESLGVKIYIDTPVNKINIKKSKAISITTTREIECDIVLSGADYAHSENLLPKDYRQYSDNYWNKKTFAPSALLFYVGIDKKLINVDHHTLFFDTSFDIHSKEIYDNPTWPKDPLFYASFPSITDKNSAPSGNEAAIFLIPIGVGIKDTPEIRKKYFEMLIDRMESITGQSLKNSILFHQSYCINDFVRDYNSYKGNAYGLANTLLQTHILRPNLKSKKVDNLFFTGQLTVPGPGVPPSIISGKIVSSLIKKYN